MFMKVHSQSNWTILWWILSFEYSISIDWLSRKNCYDWYKRKDWETKIQIQMTIIIHLKVISDFYHFFRFFVYLFFLSFKYFDHLICWSEHIRLIRVCIHKGEQKKGVHLCLLEKNEFRSCFFCLFLLCNPNTHTHKKSELKKSKHNVIWPSGPFRFSLIWFLIKKMVIEIDPHAPYWPNDRLVVCVCVCLFVCQRLLFHSKGNFLSLTRSGEKNFFFPYL